MASTKLIRKAQVNKSRAKVRKDTIKRLSWQPVIKKVDIEELKATFGAKKPAKKAAPKAKKEVKEEAPAKEVKKEETTAEEKA